MPFEDFVAIPERILEFAHQETEKEIEITILNKKELETETVKDKDV